MAGFDVKAFVAEMEAKKAKEPKIEVKLPEIAVAVVDELFATRKRMTYAQWNCLCVAAGLIKKVGPASFGLISKLGKDRQYLITNDDGSYHPNALKKWDSVTGEGRKGDAIVSNDDFIALVKSKCPAQA